jgi:adenine modification enzyme
MVKKEKKRWKELHFTMTVSITGKKSYKNMKKLLYKENLFSKEIIGATNEYIYFKEVDKSIGDKIVIKNHYSHKPTSNSFLTLLINDGLGVLQLGYGIRPCNKGLLGDICHKGNYCEFDRMWLSDDLPKFSETRTISLLLFYLKSKYKNIEYIITYADESAGNKGIIYQASNAIELKSVPVDFYILETGERVHPVSMYHRHKTRAFATLQAIYPNIKHIQGNKEGLRQRKYIYALNKKAKKRLLSILKNER